MANICNTDYCIGSSTIETLVKFNEKLKTLSENEYDEIYLEELLKSFGIDNEDEDIRTCGEIIYYNLDLENNKLWITVTSNWSGCHEVFNTINETIFNNDLIISYREIEPGCNIYDVYDPQEVFTEDCCVDTYGFDEFSEGEEYTSIAKAINVWYNVFKDKIDVNHFDKLSLEDKIDFINNCEYEFLDCYYNIALFNFLD
jgi:hypothetical protein